ncbi:hypothetical protein WAI453_005506 [Rhynchosporium graminicola]
MISRGSCLVLVAQIIAVIVHSLAKFLTTTGDIDPQQILQVRMFVTLGINSTFLITWYPEELPFGDHRVRGLLILRAFGGICGSFGFYYSLQYLPLAEATTLNLLAPLAASFLTSKRFNIVQIGSAIICFFGVGLIAKPNFLISFLDYNLENQDSIASRYSAGFLAPHDWRGLIFAVVGVVGGVCTYTSIPRIGTRAHPLATTNWFSIGSLLTSSISFTVIPGVKYNFNLGLLQWSLLLLIGICGALMDFLMTAGLAVRQDYPAIYMIYLQAVLALVGDVLIWRLIPDILSCIGSFLIIVALTITERNKEEGAEKEDLAGVEMRFQNRLP